MSTGESAEIRRLQAKICELEEERDRLTDALHQLSNEAIGKIGELEEDLEKAEGTIRKLESMIE